MEQHIVHLLKNRVDQYGNKSFYRFKDSQDGLYKSLSWNDVYRDIKLFSRSLLANGFGHESMIGIFSNNRPEWSIADYGILGIRAVTVPFFSTATKEQVKYIADETKMRLIFVGNQEQLEKASWLFTKGNTLEKIVYFGSEVRTDNPRCKSLKEFMAEGADPALEMKYEEGLAKAGLDDLATILYTSGTSGEPKGVMLTHDNFISCFKMHEERLDATTGDVSMCFLPLSHVFERTWSFYMMYCGVENVFLENPREVMDELPLANPTLMCTVPRFYEKIYEGIQKELLTWSAIKKKIFAWSIKTGHRVSEYLCKNEKAPAMLAIKYKIADRLVLGKLRKLFGSQMRTMPCSGAAIRPELLRFFHATGLFINYGYGATETTATVSCFRTDVYNFDTVGSMMPDVQVKIADNGEIHIKGKTVFKGYYNKPKETNDVLKDGWYASGDEGRVIDGGFLIMTDRMNDIFKTSVGKYVSPQKIELLVGQNKYIEQVIVFGDNRKYITALIVPSFDNLSSVATKMGISVSDNKELIKDPGIIEFLEKEIQGAQESHATFERIVKFHLLADQFSVENKSLTSTLKIRRKIITQQFEKEIEAMYR